MIVKVIEKKIEKDTNIEIVNDTLELKHIKEYINEDDLEYVSQNIRNLLKINKMNSPNCFDFQKVRTDNNIRVILYIRLSEEDGDLLEGDVSKSIKNQLLYLLNECQKRGWKVVAIFCEDGISGGDDHRPEWNKSLKYCECKRTDIVLCKSQSRFSRSMEMIEKYLHNVFIEWNIRFVGLVDNADTSVIGNKRTRQINGLVNEWNLEDQSINVRKTVKSKKENGLYCVSNSPYGYKKDPKDKEHFIIDIEASKIIKRIFEEFLEGKGCCEIAKGLNKDKIPTRIEHMNKNGINIGYSHKQKILKYETEENDTIKIIAEKYNTNYEEIIKCNNFSDYSLDTKIEEFVNKKLEKGIILNFPKKLMWDDNHIRAILKNETYTGYLALGKHRNKSYKDKTKIVIPKEEWIRVPNCQEVIITRKQWELANEKLAQNQQKFIEQKKTIPNKYVKKVYCLCCGRAFHRTKIDNNNSKCYHLNCKTGNKIGFSCDNKRYISSEELDRILLEEINKQIKKYYNYDKIEQSYNKKNVGSKIDKELNDNKTNKVNIEYLIRSKANELNMLYEDRSNGIITMEEFIVLKNKNTLDIEECKKEINNIENRIFELEKEKKEEISYEKLFTKYQEITEINRTIIEQFVEKIYVGRYDKETNSREIKIKWNLKEE